MPVIEPVVSEEKLRQLLDEQHESEQLDYKSTLCLDNTKDVVELAKDIGAMQIAGGFIVIGADCNGSLTGTLTDRDVELLDEAIVRPKLARYIPEPFEIRSAVHDIDGHRVGLIYVAPNTAGFCIFKSAGNHAKGVSFRAGDVYARHGTSSEPWHQTDIKRIIERRVEAEKETWRRELAAYIEQILVGSKSQDLSKGSAVNLTWQLDENTFLGIVIEQLRIGDTIPLRLLLNRLPSEARDLLTPDHFDDFLTLLNRVTCVAALGVNLDRPNEFAQALKCLNRIYDLGFSETGEPKRNLPVKASTLWLEIIRRVYSLGALAVRRESWEVVKSLIFQRPRGLIKSQFWNNWLRHALTMASRSGDLEERQKERKVEVPLLGLCQQTALQMSCLSEDVDQDQLLDSIVQFDVYFNIAAIGASTRSSGSDYYPNFSRYYSQRSDPAFSRLVENPNTRTTLFPGDDNQLANALRLLIETARTESSRYTGWSGVYDQAVNAFLDQHPAMKSGHE